MPAQKTIRKKIFLLPPEAAKHGFAIRLSSASPELLTRDYVSHPRRILAAGAKEGASFAAKLAGFSAVDGTLAVRQRTISLRLAVDDTKITPSSHPWEGSGIELFFAPVHGGKICQIFLVPQPGGRKVKVLDRQLKPVAGIHARIDTHAKGAGYEINVEIPFAKAGIPPEQTSFLFDTIVHLTALGDAHSGGRTSLSGVFDSSENPGHFAQVEAA